MLPAYPDPVRSDEVPRLPDHLRDPDRDGHGDDWVSQGRPPESHQGALRECKGERGWYGWKVGEAEGKGHFSPLYLAQTQTEYDLVCWLDRIALSVDPPTPSDALVGNAAALYLPHPQNTRVFPPSYRT